MVSLITIGNLKFLLMKLCLKQTIFKINWIYKINFRNLIVLIYCQSIQSKHMKETSMMMGRWVPKDR